VKGITFAKDARVIELWKERVNSFDISQ